MILHNRIKQIIKQSVLLKILSLINSVIYKGNGVQCILCGKNFKKFIAYGRPKRSNAQCPFCFSLERERLLWDYLMNQTELMDPGIKILHIAPESGFFYKLKKIHKENYTPADKLSLGNYYPDGTMDIDILNIPFTNNHFDFLICNHVLEHIEDDYRAMQELFRVLKKNGVAILLVPIDNNRKITYEDFSIKTAKMREKYFGRYDHVRIYGLDYTDRLNSVGFVVQKINYTARFNDLEIKKYGFQKGEDIYLCTKDTE